MNESLKAAFGWKGERGFSAYEIAVQNGFVGSEKDWLAMLGTSSKFEQNKVIYTTTEANTSQFDIPESYNSNSFLDIYVDGERLNSNQYSLDIENMKINLTNPIDAIGTPVEVVVVTMATNDLPIVEGLNEGSTNNEVLGAKSLFDLLPTNVKNFGAKGDGVTDDTAAIKKALAKAGNIYFPNGTYLVSEELVPYNWTTLNGETENGVIIKANNSNMKAVIKLSRSEVGEDTTNAVSGVVVSNMTIDANDIEYGIYSNYLTNESRLKNLTIVNASKCNFCLVKSWFISVDNITAKNGKNIGISLGVAQGNEELVSLNGVNFSNLRAHTNGLDQTHNQSNNLERGCGILVGMCNACEFDIIQSELNYGIGVILKAYYNNHFGTMYLENNSRNQTNRYSLYQVDGSTIGQTIEKVLLAFEQTIYADEHIYINRLTRTDALKTMYGTGRFYVDMMDYSVLSNQEDFTIIDYKYNVIFNKMDVDTRYTSELDSNFIAPNIVRYPFLTVIPKATLTDDNELTIKFGDNTYSFGNSFVAGKPITKRMPSLLNPGQVIKVTTTTVTKNELKCDIYIGYYTYGSRHDEISKLPYE